MATLHQQDPTPPPKPQPQPTTAPTITFGALVSIVIACAFVLGCTIVVFVLILSRRRTKADRHHNNHLALLNDEDVVVLSCSDGDGADGSRSSAEARMAPRRKLQKACSVGAWPGYKVEWDSSGDVVGKHKSMPLIPRVFTTGHFGFGRSASCKWPPVATGEPMRVCRKKASWIDEDALHGPKVRRGGGPLLPVGAGRKKNRGSWPLRNMAPTLPRLHHTVHGYPSRMGGRWDEEALLEGVQAAPDYYAQLRAISRLLPEPPKPARVANKDKQVVRPSVSMVHVYATNDSRIPRPCPSPAASPVRSLPTTPSRPRGRQQSSDSTLTEILKSTEKRLRAGSIPDTTRNNNRLTASPTRILGPREYGVPRSQIRTPSPNKRHKRQESQNSVSSETDSLLAEECLIPDAPSGLTSPSWNQRKQEPDRSVQKVQQQVQSGRSSVSSELSTLYSEDEMPEVVRKAMMPLEGFVVQPQQAANVGLPTQNDPFVTAPLLLSTSRASIGHAWPTKQHKAQDLFRESLESSQRLRQMTLGQCPVQSQGLILAPSPALYGPRPYSTTGNLRSRRVSVTIPRSMQPYLEWNPSRASEPPPSPTRQSPTSKSPKGPLFLRITKTSTLSTIPLLPPPAAPGLDTLKDARRMPLAPIKTVQLAKDQQRQSPVLMLPSTERSSAPSSPTRRAVGGGETRLSLILSPKQQQQPHPTNRISASSSIYSQEPPSSTTKSPADLNRASFHTNSLLPISLSALYPAPLCPRNRHTTAAAFTTKPSAESLLLAAAQHFEDADEVDDDEDEDEDTPLAVTTTIASLRRMNSGISTASSLRSIPDRNPTPSSGRASPAVGGGGVTASAAASHSGGSGGGGGEGGGNSPAGKEHVNRKSMMGARNYFTMRGTGGGQSRRASRVVSGVGGGIGKMAEGGGGGGVVRGGSVNGGGAGSPYKRRRPGSAHRQRRNSMLRVSAVEVAGEEGKENDGSGGFKMVAGEFTFEVGDYGSCKGGGGLGLREGSAGSVNMLAMQPPPLSLSLPWKLAAAGSASRSGSPVRHGECPSRGSLKSLESLGLYDRQGFLISASPVRGPSPALRI